jgi:prevent-host-death family protein
MSILMYIMSSRRTSYSIAEARSDLPRLVHAAERGRAIPLTRRGKLVAVLVSIDAWEAATRQRVSFQEAFAAFRAQHDLAELDLAGALVEVRARERGRPSPFR